MARVKGDQAGGAIMEAITALGKEDGAKVFYELGKNPDEAARIEAFRDSLEAAIPAKRD